jgi:hypothetical protein
VRSDTALARRLLSQVEERPRGIVWHDYGRVPDVTTVLDQDSSSNIVHVLGTTLCYECHSPPQRQE